VIRRVALAVAALLVAVAAAPARAGDRKLEVLFVNMTPDAASTPASKACVRAIEKRVAEDYTELQRMGETKLRSLAGKSAGEPFMSWPRAALDGAPRQRDPIAVDAILLVDCRPETKTLDVLVAPAANGLVRLRLRRVPLDAAALKLVAEALLRRAWSGFMV